MGVSGSDAAREAMVALRGAAVDGGGWVGAGDLLLTLASLEEREVQVTRLCDLAWEMADLYGASPGFVAALQGICGDR